MFSSNLNLIHYKRPVILSYDVSASLKKDVREFTMAAFFNFVFFYSQNLFKNTLGF